VGEATVIRLCQAIGCRGYQALKLCLAQELVRPAAQLHEDVDPADSLEVVAAKVFESELAALRDTLAILDGPTLTRAVELLLDARQILFVGVGTSAPIAADAYLRFARIGLPCSRHEDSVTQASLGAQAGPQTALLAVSYSGSTRETVEAVSLARAGGAATIVITGYRRSPITRHADAVLCTAGRETLFRPEAAASRLAALAIVDVLCVGVALRRLDASLAAVATWGEVLARRRF
jgi:RpiR family transcriptional regulator, carbohydrate utilization regulator